MAGNRVAPSGLAVRSRTGWARFLLGFAVLFAVLLGLPEIDGLTVLDRWRKEGRKMPVLVLTARDSWSDKVAELDAGADDYLHRPFTRAEVLARARAGLRATQQRADDADEDAGDEIVHLPPNLRRRCA